MEKPVKRNEIPRFLPVALVGACGVALLLNLYELVFHFSESATMFNEAVYVCATLCALLYCVYGFRKEAAKYYALVGYSLLLTQCTSIIICVEAGAVQNMPSLVCAAVAVACLGILCFVKNLGEQKSKSFSMVVAGSLLLFAVCFAIQNGFIPTLPLLVSNLSLASVYGMMVFGKYQDKKTRGTT